MAEAAEDFFSFWKNMEPRARAGLVFGAIVILAGAILLSWWLLKRDYQALFTGLDERDAAAIVTELKRLKIPYRIDGDANTIRVPAEVVHETRISLMGRGVNISGGVGFEIFDNKDLGMTEYTQKINYQRALQGELARTIMSIEDVKVARVHLVLPEASIFKREKSRSKASVSLVLKPGGRLTAEQIIGIQRLVAAAAPGLDAGMVTVLDQRGIALSAVSDAESVVGLGSGQLRMKQEVEQYLTRKAGEVLDRAFGPGQAIVSVDVALNFDEVKRTAQDVLPSHADGEGRGVIVRKRQTQQNQARAGLMTKANGDYPQESGEGANSNSTLELDYEVGRRVEQVVTMPGGVRRISVGVLIPHGLTEAQVSRLRALIAMAVGLDEHRGDAIAVHGLDQLMLESAKSEGVASAPAEASPPESASRIAGRSDARKELPEFTPSAQQIALAVGALALVLLVSFALLRRRGREAANVARTSDLRRQELLAEVKGWLRTYKTESAESERP